MSDKEEYIRRLDKIERDLQWLIQYTLKKDNPLQPPPFTTPNTYKTGDRCYICGIDFSQNTGYVCASQYCPMKFVSFNNLGSFEEYYEE